VAEPSVLDEVSEIKDTELAMVTPDGIKIFGRYDFEFSVASPVLQFINFFVAGRGHSTMEVGLQRSGRYRQMVEKIFKEERVPLDLMWLAQAESVWKPNALSRAAAKGIWQFIPSTGTRYGLAQTTWVDDRSQPEKSTRAAARYLRWLHDHFAGDWLLAMAAYNSGENRVDSAIAKCGYADFWELYKRGLLPQETRNYVPCILSIIIISKNQKLYGFNITPDLPLLYDTFDVPGQTDLKVVSDLINVPYETVQDLNAELRRGTSPAGEKYTIKIPKGMKKQFEVAYADLPEAQRVRKVTVPVDEVPDGYRSSYRVQLASYQVRRGDTLASVARRSGVSVNELARLNRMSARGELRKGQTVKIPQQVRAGRSRQGRIGRYRTMPVVRSSQRKASSKARYSGGRRR
jgi:membrane-bound lytic murein transglycosylase D